MWASIFNEGTYQNKAGEDVSKNWDQERLMQNSEWEGSVTQALTQEHISLGDAFDMDTPETETVATDPTVTDLPTL